MILINQEAITSRLKQLRVSFGLSQYALAEALHISRPSIRNWELGSGIPTTAALVELAIYFNVTTDYLLGLDNRKFIQVDFLSDQTVAVLSKLVHVINEEKANAKKEMPDKNK